ncbi:unnamed protein product [Malus baccata var. baccata]
MFLAVIRCQATAALLNAAYTAEELEFNLSDSESKLLIMLEEPIHTAQAAASKLNIPHVTTNLSATANPVTLSSAAKGILDSVSQLVNDLSDMALFLHTSGTTSRPKRVPLTQLNLASSVQNIKSVYKIIESDSTVIVLPLFHVHRLITGLLSSFSAEAAATLPAAVSLAWRLLLVLKGDEGFEVMEAGNNTEERNRDDKQTRLQSGQNRKFVVWTILIGLV